MSASATEYWHNLLRPDVELSADWWQRLATEMRAARLTFGDRLNCPFLRPFFLDPGDVARVAKVAETIVRLGERVAHTAAKEPALLEAAGLTEAERALVAIEPGYSTVSTASRLDAFLLPTSLWFAEYNAESPAGLGYTEILAELFDRLEIMDRFRQRFEAHHYGLCESMLQALIASYRDWGGTAEKPFIAIVDWREVPTWNEFQILRERFDSLGVPTIVADPRDLSFDGRRLTASGRAIDLVYRRVLINDIVAHPAECHALMEAYRSQTVCVANTLRCKVPHKKAFFAVLTDPRWAPLFDSSERTIIEAHIPWTRLIADVRTTEEHGTVDLLALVRHDREHLVIKPNDEYGGTGVTLGWETTPSAWDAAIDHALASPPGTWVVQRRIAVRREVFPYVESERAATHGQGAGAVPHSVVFREMLVDFAPYLFRGRLAGFLTRLSGSGLANVTSGGGQVPSFVVNPREEVRVA
jgi:uncharacterized circularly permuted ATP-grasp superfamily protein